MFHTSFILYKKTKSNTTSAAQTKLHSKLKVDKLEANATF